VTAARPGRIAAPRALALLWALGAGACADVVPERGAFAGPGGVADAAAVADAAGDAADAADAAVGPDADAAAAADAAADTDAADADAAPACDPAACGPAPSPCQQWSCAGGACTPQPRPDGASCDDGLDCTSATACQGGACVAGKSTCVCLTDADCANKEDGDLCNGTLYCALSGGSAACLVNPATVVACPSVDDTACVVNTCQPKTGACAMAPVKPAAGAFFVPCEDGNPCTQQDQCLDGVCSAGTNVCACKSNADCAAKEDGDPCNGTLFCDLLAPAPACKVNPVTVVACADDGNPCTDVTCDPASGACVAVAKNENAPCDDGDPCTSETCLGGVCSPGASACGCKKDADCAKFNPKNLCAGSYYCAKSDKGGGACQINPATVVACSKADDGPCKATACAPASGACVTTPASKQQGCDDGVACTVGDKCDGEGACEPGTSTCLCAKDADCAAAAGADLCQGKVFCDTSGPLPVCKVNPATVVTCPQPAGEPCRVGVCEPKTGACSVVDKPDSTDCVDGLACLEKGSCVGGVCVASVLSCGCVTDKDCADKQGADPCLGQRYCDKSSGEQKKWVCALVPQSAVVCPAGDGGSCLASVCDSKTGACAPQPAPGACDDGNPCTADVCKQDGACAHGVAPDGAACGAGQACAAGACVALPAEMVLIPGGEGYGGCAKGDTTCAAAEGAPTLVTLAPFLIDRREVSVADFAANCPGCTVKPSADGALCNAGKPERQLHPANCLSWAAANAYCQAQGKVLPSEAQWERAARAGCAFWGDDCLAKTPIYPWALGLASCDFAVMQGDAGPGCDGGTTAPVGSYSQDESPHDVRDLGGNVREWVADGWSAAPWAGAPLVEPKAPPAADGARVVKGGDFQSTALGLRISRRESLASTVQAPGVGFRCAKPL
jgi:formylglycine-generating enzyme required for sulfatase activity